MKPLVQCIFHQKEMEAKSIEHIISESFGNKIDVMEKGAVCDECNRRFSVFEEKALSRTIYAMERAKNAVMTKKGNTVKGKIGDLEIFGSTDFEEKKISIKGLNEANFTDFDPKTGTGKLIVPSFDKSESASSKFLLKVGLESLYTSRRNLYKKYDFSDLRAYLLGESNVDWPIMTTNYEPQKFTSVPRFGDKKYLQSIRCHLACLEVDENTLLFKFKYGIPSMTINLLNRDGAWIKEFTQADKGARLYPEHFRKKLGISYEE